MTADIGKLRDLAQKTLHDTLKTEYDKNSTPPSMEFIKGAAETSIRIVLEGLLGPGIKVEDHLEIIVEGSPMLGDDSDGKFEGGVVVSYRPNSNVGSYVMKIFADDIEVV